MSLVFFTDRDLGKQFPSVLKDAGRIERFVAKHSPPYVAKVYRASVEELARNPLAPGRVEQWYP